MRSALVVMLAAAAVLAGSAVATDGPNVVYFPIVRVLPRQDTTAHGQLQPSLTKRSPAFCWELDLFTRKQPLDGYLRRARTGRVVAHFSLRDNHVPPQPWPRSAHFSGCDIISRSDERAFLSRPRFYYLDIRTRLARHAAIAHPHGPPLN